MTKADNLTGVKCFSIAGRMIEARERCLGMTDEERRWRAQWLKDQVLSPDEPKYVPEYYKQTNNFIRRLWKTPMNKLQASLESSLGHDAAFLLRHGVGKLFVGIALLYVGVYYIKYHTNDFESRSMEIYTRSRRMYPFEPDYPNYFVAKTPSDYYDQGFYSSVLCQDVILVEDIPPPPPPPPPPPVKQEEPEVCPALAKEE